MLLHDMSAQEKFAQDALVELKYFDKLTLNFLVEQYDHYDL
jgi:hypothetical protein